MEKTHFIGSSPDRYIRERCLRLLVLAPLALASVSSSGCDDEDQAAEASDTLDTSGDDLDPRDSEQPDDDALDVDPRDTEARDADQRECQKVRAEVPWVLSLSDSVSVEYTGSIDPEVEVLRTGIRLLFERYTPGPDLGTFELGGDGPDGNFGTCAHCLYAAVDSTKAYFADRGTLTLLTDPYSLRMDAIVTDLRLVEVDVRPEDRFSTPVPGGECLEFSDFSVTGVFPPAGWNCDDELYNDDTACDCECGVPDPDCGVDDQACPPFDPMCPPPQGPFPIVGCEPEQFCAFDAESGDSVCQDGCVWADRAQPCPNDSDICVFDDGAAGRDRCLPGDGQRFSLANHTQDCGSSIFQQFCNVEDGFALGYCGPGGVCRPICESDEECTTEGETCRGFVDPDGLGYCGPEPVDPDDG